MGVPGYFRDPYLDKWAEPAFRFEHDERVRDLLVQFARDVLAVDMPASVKGVWLAAVVDDLVDDGRLWLLLRNDDYRVFTLPRAQW